MRLETLGRRFAEVLKEITGVGEAAARQRFVNDDLVQPASTRASFT
jgi:hypothetical protein